MHPNTAFFLMVEFFKKFKKYFLLTTWQGKTNAREFQSIALAYDSPVIRFNFQQVFTKQVVTIYKNRVVGL